MKDRYILRYLLPVVVMVVFTALLLIEMLGITIEARGPSMALLSDAPPQTAAADAAPARILVARNQANEAEMAFASVMTDVLREMRLSYQTVDISSEPLPDLTPFDALLYCSQSLLPLEHTINTLLSWVDGGGHFALTMTPIADNTFRILYRKLGITEYAAEYYEYHSLQYESVYLPLWGKTIYSENSSLIDYAMVVQLDPRCLVHIRTGDNARIPLLWECPSGEGRIAVLNTTLMAGRPGRGFAMAVLTALCDTLAYPIINAGMIFIDDFPAPQPEGFNEKLKKEFGYNIQGFFRNHWWPDMKLLAWDYGLRYTGVLIETYNTNVRGPFNAKGVDDSLLKYYTAELLHSGGEMGLHGYNHMPLGMSDYDFGDTNYTPWPSTRAMSRGLSELYRYGKTLYINADFQTYVPPSNMLSVQGREALLQTLPNIKVLSGVYLPEAGVESFVQEFDEADDGVIDVPRITSGFETDDFMDFVAAQELVLHGVYSHFIHPDDVLDPERSAKLNWEEMFALFQARIKALSEAYPNLRFLTAQEGAAAVQRYARLNVRRDTDTAGLTLTLSPFYDEAWLALRTRKLPASITGGALFKITDGFYWIRADEAVVRVLWEAGS